MSTRTAFLTGATGFIGSNLAIELLASGRERIYCLVRPNGDIDARLRGAVVESARAAGRLDQIADRLDHLVAVPGDVALPGLGLTVERQAMLRSETPAECWHAAASLRYEDRHKDEILRTNVDGTRHLLDTVAELGIGSLHHISTAYVAGLRVGDVAEEPYDPGFGPNNWYETSKRAGEDLVVERCDRFQQVTIMRPSIVIGNLSTLRSTSTSGYYGFLTGLRDFCRFVEGSREGYLDENTVKLFLDPRSSLDLVPIDLLVAEAVAIADSGRHDRYVHLTNPFPINLERARIGPESSISRLRLEVAEHRSQLGPMDVILDDALDFYRPYLRNDKRFIRGRDANRPPEAMRISDETLAGLSVAHFQTTDDFVTS